MCFTRALVPDYHVSIMNYVRTVLYVRTYACTYVRTLIIKLYNQAIRFVARAFTYSRTYVRTYVRNWWSSSSKSRQLTTRQTKILITRRIVIVRTYIIHATCSVLRHHSTSNHMKHPRAVIFKQFGSTVIELTCCSIPVCPQCVNSIQMPF